MPSTGDTEMGMELLLYNGQNPETGRVIEFDTPEWVEVVESGLLKLPTCTADDGRRVIDLDIFRIRVEQIIGTYKTSVTKKKKLQQAVEQYRYLRPALRGR